MVILGIIYLNQGGDNPGEEGTNFLSQFNPFGGGGGKTPGDNPAPVDLSGDQPSVPKEESSLVRVSSMPIAGYVIFLKERLKEETAPAPVPEAETNTQKNTKPTPPSTETASALRYVERTTGNIYQTFADKISEKKFSATIIPKVYEALFGNNGETVFMRYLKPDGATIETFWGILPKEVLGGDSTTEAEIRGTFLPDNIKNMNISPDSKSVFYIFNVGDGAVGATLDIASGKKTQIFDSPFSEWLSEWPNSKMITLTTKPAYGVSGYMYRLDPITKSFYRVLGSINGLTTLTSPDGRSVLYADGNLYLNIYDVGTREVQGLGIRTLPEKCAWAQNSEYVYCGVPKSIPQGSYPDIWYQGEASFNDNVWRLDRNTGNGELIADLSDLSGGLAMDGIKLTADKDSHYLFLINKIDSFLWRLELK